MPELPEVESIRIQLEKFLVGHKVSKVEVHERKILGSGENKLIGGKVIKIRRFGKVLSVDLNNGYSFLVHLKLTGQLIYRGPNLKNPPKLSSNIKNGIPGKHTHVIFHLSLMGRSGSGRDRGGRLYYNDVRKFGWIKIVKSKNIKAKSKFIGKLGPEPFGFAQGKPSNALTFRKFMEIVGSTKRNIKTLLMDQTKIAGIGNIYANDALWDAAINPRKSANSLNNEQIKKLFDAIEKVLKEGLKRGGASDQYYVTPEGGEGTYQKHFLVYGRTGKICTRPACRQAGAKIERITLSGRGTFFCPKCQK